MNVFVESGITHLDLHRVRHHDAKDLVMDFVLQYQDSIPLIIICGNSNRMIELAKDMLLNNDIIFSEPRYGIIRIESL
jgi:hypothetical protein|tara:strand:- start:1552 stop:1785 length:234 start_codon:yes stop_codon:yes gene_type:complete